jgi:hypothetical protein
MILEHGRKVDSPVADTSAVSLKDREKYADSKCGDDFESHDDPLRDAECARSVAALPQHSAERLRLSGWHFNFFEAAPQSEAQPQSFLDSPTVRQSLTALYGGGAAGVAAPMLAFKDLTLNEPRSGGRK